MTDYASVSDSSNPFNTTGLSLEDKALIQYVIDAKADTGHDLVVTCTTDHKMLTSAGHVSRHRQIGTAGEGLAIDGRMRTRGTAKGLHRAFFDAFAKVENQLHELIYADAPFNIKAGQRVEPYAVSSHRDHVHVAVSRAVFLKYPKPVTPEEARMRVPNAVSAVRSPNGGVWVLSKEGGVYAFGGAPYLDAYNTHPEWGGDDRSFVAIVNNDEGGYDLLADDGALYSFAPG